MNTTSVSVMKQMMIMPPSLAIRPVEKYPQRHMYDIPSEIFSSVMSVKFPLFFVECFDKGKGGRPNGIKREIKKFFQKLDAVEHCFFNNSEVIDCPVSNFVFVHRHDRR